MDTFTPFLTVFRLYGSAFLALSCTSLLPTIGNLIVQASITCPKSIPPNILVRQSHAKREDRIVNVL